MDIVQLYELVRPFWVVWLLILFGGIIFWAFRPGSKDRMERFGSIPLNDDD